VEVRAATTAAGVKTVDPDPKERVLWDLTYIDAPAMVERDTNTDGTRDQRLWPTWDANFNVTGLLTKRLDVFFLRAAGVPTGKTREIVLRKISDCPCPENVSRG
jgi:hypothetical protein